MTSSVNAFLSMRFCCRTAINIIRRGDFKKLDQELETGWKRGMFNFHKSFELREHEGYVSSTKVISSGFSWEESVEYLNRQEEISD